MHGLSLTGFAKLMRENSIPPFLISGPCALENEDISLEIAEVLKELSGDLEIPVFFKGSYSKANRTREDSFHGVGLQRGLEILQAVKQSTGLPVTSDVHSPQELEKAAVILDIIQIPMLLCKNTDILHAAGETDKIINIKKGHYASADDMRYSLEKIRSRGNDKIMLTERGNVFGYNDIIVDFRNIQKMKTFGCPVIFDASHSVRNLSCRSEDPEGGDPEAIPMLTRCAAAAGVDGLFVETYPIPENAQCDAVSSYPLEEMLKLMKSFVEIAGFTRRTLKDENIGLLKY